MVAEEMMGIGTCTAGGSDGSGVVGGGGTSVTGCELGGGVGVGNLVVEVGEFPLCGECPGGALREDHRSRRSVVPDVGLRGLALSCWTVDRLAGA